MSKGVSLKKLLPLSGLSLLAACATVAPPPAAPLSPPPIEVQVIGLNDFHGNIEPPAPVEVDGQKRALGGAAFLARKVQQLRQAGLPTVTVSAGDLIGASPLTSAFFLDEPTILAMNMIGLDLNAVGNHEFDKGSAELKRMQSGGCAKHTSRQPCAVDRAFAGASFGFLAANVRTANGTTLLPGTALRQMGPVKIGFVGMTLTETATLVTPAGVAGLRFEGEVATANAAATALRAQGADSLVLLIHQGGRTVPTYNVTGCPGLEGGIVPILDKLDPGFGLVVSGHTHFAYACQRPAADGSVRLLTSAGKNGLFVSDIRLTFDGASKRLVAAAARNEAVTRETADPAVGALVARYAAAAAPAANRIVGRLTSAAMRDADDGESDAARLIADAQLAATHTPARGGAQIGLINGSGVRTSLVPDAGGALTYAKIFALQPFGNNLVVKTLSGAQLKAVLEQQFEGDAGKPARVKSLLIPSRGFAFTYDLARGAGERIRSMTLGGRPIDPARDYRVVVNNFLSSGGDGFSALASGRDAFDAGLDLDALEAWLATNRTVPTDQRTRAVAR
jgi:5'-nucleotidase